MCGWNCSAAMNAAGTVVHEARLVSERGKHLGQHRRGVAVVVDDEHAAGRPAAPARELQPCDRLATLQRRLRERQADRELGARASTAAGGRHAAAVQLDEAPHDRQAEAETAARALERLRLLHEEVEDSRQHVGCDADCRCR